MIRKPSPHSGNSAAGYARKHLASHWLNLTLILMKNIVGALLYMVPPMLSKYILETVLPQQNGGLLALVAVCMVAAPIVGSVMIVWENMWGRFMLRLAGQGRADLYNGIQHRPLDWIRQHRTGDLLTRLLDDTYTITDKVNGQIGFLLFHVVTILTGAAILIVLQPLLAPAVLLLWIGQAFVMSRLGREIKQRAANSARQHSRISEAVRELAAGASFLKASGRETKALTRLQASLHQEWANTRQEMMTDHRSRLLNAAMSAAILVLMYAGGGWMVMTNGMTLGSLVAFIAVYNWLRPFGSQMIEMVLSVIKIWPSINRVAEIAWPVEPPPIGKCPVGPITLEVKGISLFLGNRLVLDNVSFALKPGSVLSVVGHRGAGKSTMADLLLGLTEPTSGRITFNGILLSATDVSWFRSSVLCVTQEVTLRSGTILDNILFGYEPRDSASLEHAIRIAQLEEWIARLPDGLHTQVGEHALQLSGGERQRISVARALLRRPKVLILDEATSALDPGTERRLLERMLKERKETTFLFITHRLDIARLSDEILVLDQGRLVQKGTHRELRESPGVYRELWKSQESALLPLHHF